MTAVNTSVLLFLGIAWAVAALLVLILVLRAAARGDFAPGWQIRCLTCGRTRNASEAGIVRLGARGTKYTLAKCCGCERIRWAAIERDPVAAKKAKG
jgi:hypothetical protein